MSTADHHIHVVSFDVPYPPTYGGVIDVYYKLKALHAKGVKVHLHCFQYGREESSHLESLCEEVKYYPRNVSRAQLFTRLPYIVISRNSEKLIQELADLDNEVLEKLVELKKSKKAIAMVTDAQSWQTIKEFIM